MKTVSPSQERSQPKTSASPSSAQRRPKSSFKIPHWLAPPEEQECSTDATEQTRKTLASTTLKPRTTTPVTATTVARRNAEETCGFPDGSEPQNDPGAKYLTTRLEVTRRKAIDAIFYHSGGAKGCNAICEERTDSQVKYQHCISGCCSRIRFAACNGTCSKGLSGNSCNELCCKAEIISEHYKKCQATCRASFFPRWRAELCIEMCSAIHPTDLIQPSRTEAECESGPGVFR
ncbi:unnamed protein product [Dicrocoelium dendriticum]|nr:unnamed protein product [Dicrocoelium dendriticum]